MPIWRALTSGRRRLELVHAEAEHRGGGVEDELGGDLAGSADVEDVGQHHLGHLEGQGLPVEAGEGRHPDQGAFELPDVVLHVGGDELEHVGRDRGLFPVRLLAQDGQAGLELGRLHVGDQAPLEPAAQAVLQRGDRAWVAVG
jgi:hypothetical protein